MSPLADNRIPPIGPGEARIALPMRQIEAFCRRWGVAELALFGSVLRDDFADDSDVDVLIRTAVERRYRLEDWMRMEEELAAIFGRAIDLVDRANIDRSENWYRRRHILDGARMLHVA